jgi:hypothetical protein
VLSEEIKKTDQLLSEENIGLRSAKENTFPIVEMVRVDFLLFKSQNVFVRLSILINRV